MDDHGNSGDGVYRPFGVFLNRGDLLTDAFGCIGGLRGQFFHFVGDDGEAIARFPSARSFDRGVQGQQVGLLGDGVDGLDDLADFGAGNAQLGDDRIGGLDGLHRHARYANRFGGVLGDFIDGGTHFLRASSDRLQVAVDLFCGRGNNVGLSGRSLGIGSDLLAGGGELLARVRHLLRVFGNRCDGLANGFHRFVQRCRHQSHFIFRIDVQGPCEIPLGQRLKDADRLLKRFGNGPRNYNCHSHAKRDGHEKKNDNVIAGC